MKRTANRHEQSQHSVQLSHLSKKLVDACLYSRKCNKSHKAYVASYARRSQLIARCDVCDGKWLPGIFCAVGGGGNGDDEKNEMGDLFVTSMASHALSHLSTTVRRTEKALESAAIDEYVQDGMTTQVTGLKKLSKVMGYYDSKKYDAEEVKIWEASDAIGPNYVVDEKYTVQGSMGILFPKYEYHRRPLVDLLERAQSIEYCRDLSHRAMIESLCMRMLLMSNDASDHCIEQLQNIQRSLCVTVCGSILFSVAKSVASYRCHMIDTCSDRDDDTTCPIQLYSAHMLQRLLDRHLNLPSVHQINGLSGDVARDYEKCRLDLLQFIKDSQTITEATRKKTHASQPTYDPMRRMVLDPQWLKPSGASQLPVQKTCLTSHINWVFAKDFDNSKGGAYAIETLCRSEALWCALSTVLLVPSVQFLTTRSPNENERVAVMQLIEHLSDPFECSICSSVHTRRVVVMGNFSFMGYHIGDASEWFEQDDRVVGFCVACASIIAAFRRLVTATNGMYNTAVATDNNVDQFCKDISLVMCGLGKYVFEIENRAQFTTMSAMIGLRGGDIRGFLLHSVMCQYNSGGTCFNGSCLEDSSSWLDKYTQAIPTMRLRVLVEILVNETQTDVRSGKVFWALEDLQKLEELQDVMFIIAKESSTGGGIGDCMRRLCGQPILPRMRLKNNIPDKLGDHDNGISSQSESPVAIADMENISRLCSANVIQ